jgi:hypothetical protein
MYSSSGINRMIDAISRECNMNRKKVNSRRILLGKISLRARRDRMGWYELD